MEIALYQGLSGMKIGSFCIDELLEEFDHGKI
jgi:hypothetical protein